MNIQIINATPNVTRIPVQRTYRVDDMTHEAVAKFLHYLDVYSQTKDRMQLVLSGSYLARLRDLRRAGGVKLIAEIPEVKRMLSVQIPNRLADEIRLWVVTYSTTGNAEYLDLARDRLNRMIRTRTRRKTKV